MQWTDPTWLAAAHAWIEEHATLTGATEQVHVERWSTVLRVPTADGDLYFKANEPAQRYEAALVQLLASRRPDCIPTLVAADLERGWMLMEDAGTRLRDVIDQERDLSRWLDVLPLYAQLQIDAAPDTEAFIAAGVPDMRLAVLAGKYEDLLEAMPALAVEEPCLRDAVPRVRAWCDELVAFGLPETIQHDDLHDAQVYVRDGRYLVVDWGDACVSHPFFTLSVTLDGNVSWGLEDVRGSVDIAPFRDAYLAPFEALARVENLQAAAAIALRLGWICRAVNGALGGTPAKHTLVRLRMAFD
jgi:hypothetical protein